MKIEIQMNSERVLLRLARANCSVGELAKQSGLGTGHLSQLLDGKRSPTAAVRRRLIAGLAAVLGESLQFDDVFTIIPLGHADTTIGMRLNSKGIS